MSLHRPTILQIIPRLDTGGAERTTLEITEAITNAGGRALVATEGGGLLPKLLEAGGEFIEMNVGAKNPAVIASNIFKLRSLIHKENIDLLHARSRAPAWSALAASRMTARPFVTTYHGAYTERSKAKRLYNSIMARGDLVIANSNYIASQIRSRYDTDSSRVRTIYRGLDQGFDPSKVSAERLAAVRAQWGVRTDQPIILHAARMSNRKGQSTLISAAGLIASKPELGDWVVILAGDPRGRETYIEELNSQIASAGLQQRIRFVGRANDMAAACLASHVAVTASVEPEAFGRVAAEAEAMECPVIATDIGGAPETVRAEPKVGPGEITGWLVPPGDAEALARCLDAALRLSEAERTAIGQRARAYVMERFTLTAMQQATLKVYDTLLGTNMAQQTQP